mmetsp:Transcript_48083/g.119046  ORF Transcript_48083/g.119046 Transcript_48083/m.119046 type:complete len:113 (-) Transcript_48083:1196-1534(-)
MQYVDEEIPLNACSCFLILQLTWHTLRTVRLGMTAGPRLPRPSCPHSNTRVHHFIAFPHALLRRPVSQKDTQAPHTPTFSTALVQPGMSSRAALFSAMEKRRMQDNRVCMIA